MIIVWLRKYHIELEIHINFAMQPSWHTSQSQNLSASNSKPINWYKMIHPVTTCLIKKVPLCLEFKTGLAYASKDPHDAKSVLNNTANWKNATTEWSQETTSNLHCKEMQSPVGRRSARTGCWLCATTGHDTQDHTKMEYCFTHLNFHVKTYSWSTDALGVFGQRGW